MHLGRSEHRVTLPVMRTAVKRKGYIIPTKPDLYTPSPPRCHRKLVFHGVAACGDVSESRYYEGAAAPLPPPPRILSSDPPPFVSLSPPPCFSSLPRLRKEFVITRRIVWGKLGQPLRGITPRKVGTIGEASKTYKQISPPPYDTDLVFPFLFISSPFLLLSLQRRI